ncbi:helix-turn-helix domain-containing protein [Obesumbacterium proteus]|uniref:helix-turn-helix domain-containing protein n=1 Tax=Obesumbacterium proteus TaxID=82983 RepID=UPI000699D27B|nr:helix-turn-helix transcriptional regulator [Obesumbacterium proteus]
MQILDLNSVGLRIRQVRGNLSQSDFATRLGLERKSISRYESGERSPDATFFFYLLIEFKVDPIWLLTGSGEQPELSPDEQELLMHFRVASLSLKSAALAALTAGNKTAKSYDNNQIVHGDVGQSISGDATFDAPLNISIRGHGNK